LTLDSWLFHKFILFFRIYSSKFVHQFISSIFTTICGVRCLQLFAFVILEKYFGQILHWNGFSPVWLRVCLERSAFDAVFYRRVSISVTFLVGFLVYRFFYFIDFLIPIQFLQKIWKIFRQKLAKILIENRNFGQKSKFWSKIEIRIENRNVGRKS